MIEMINGKAYVKKGDKVYEVGGGGSNFLFANSKEELPDPSTVPENTVAFVPSEDDTIPTFDLVEMGVPAITTTLTPTQCDTVKLQALRSALDKAPVIIKYDLIMDGALMTTMVTATKAMAGISDAHQIMINGYVDGVGVVMVNISLNEQYVITQYFVLNTNS